MRAFATQVQQTDAAERGRQMLALAMEWLGPLPQVDADTIAGNQTLAVFQCVFAAIQADGLAGGAAAQGLGYAFGGMVGQQSAATQHALLEQFQRGMNRGLTDVRASLKPQGSA